MALPVTSVEVVDDAEILFFNDVDKYLNSLNEKFREKHIIKKIIHQNIIVALSLEKGKSSKSFSPAFAFWARKNFEKKEITGVDILYCISSKKPVCIYESFYHVIQECHKNISHAGRDKTIAQVAIHYSWISTNIAIHFLESTNNVL
ncbi:unnamed protein product [Didymodactylos carnosus]|uniref:Uncharacterized protein n=1 Tax=Didymodactylos carnosus TaxID=1234261 RepID=A0A8S2X5Y1_9BILA|nr:unnamed protein product [Didymodactylos carnosus]